MKIFFLLNPSQRKKEWDLRELGAQTAKRYGWTPRFAEVDRQRPHSTEHLLRQAWEEECSRIGVIGGDGTLHRVINVLHRHQRLKTMEIAVIPTGTCNDFARVLGFQKKRLEEAFRIACTGKAQAIDLGAMDSELFINTAGIGRQGTPKRLPSKPLSTLKSFRPISATLRWEKGSMEGTFFMALICNGPYFSGGLYMSKSPRLTDGFLDAYLVPVMAKWKLVPLLMMGKLGRPVRSRQMISLRIQDLEIHAQTDLWPQADGEPPTKAVRRVLFSISPEKAMIVMPSAI